MVTKSKKQTTTEEQKKSRVKVGNLKLNKETVKDLSATEAQKIKGGQKPPTIGQTQDCPSTPARCGGV